MYLDEFQKELSRVMWDLDCQKRSEDRALEIISSLIDDFSVRFTSRADVVTYAADRIEKMHYTLAPKLAAAVRKWSGSAPEPARFTYQALGATADGGGFPAHEGLLTSYKEAVACLANCCWTKGTGWIEIRKAGETIAHVCFDAGRRYKVYLFNRGERS